MRNRQDTSVKFQTDVDTTLRDFYWRYARGLEKVDTTTKYTVTTGGNTETLDAPAKQKFASKHFYEVSFGNKGGLVMPIIIEWTFKDGSKEVERIPAQVWRMNESKVTKFFMKDKEVASIRLDPMRETADINEANNNWGEVKEQPSRFQVFKQKQAAIRGQSSEFNPMSKSEEKKGF